MHIAALIINHEIPELDALQSAYQPLGIYPSRAIAEREARRISIERNTDGYTVFPETSDIPLHRRIIEQIRNKRETNKSPAPFAAATFASIPKMPPPRKLL